MKEQQWHCQCACMCHCLDVKYHSRCCKHWVHAVVCNVLLELLSKTKQKCNLFCRRHTLCRAQYKTQHNGKEKGQKLSQDTNWNINNKTRTTAKMHCRCQKLGENDCVLGNETDWGESYFCEYFLRKKEKRRQLCFKTLLCHNGDLFSGHIWQSTVFFLPILKSQAALSRSLFKSNNLKIISPHYWSLMCKWHNR